MSGRAYMELCSSTDKLDAAAHSYIAYDVMSTNANLEARNARLRLTPGGTLTIVTETGEAVPSEISWSSC